MEYEIANQDTNILSEKNGLATHLITSGDNYHHTHNFIEVFYIIKGSINHLINNTTETLHTGDMYLLRPGDVHCFLREQHNSCVHRDIMFTTYENEHSKVCKEFDAMYQRRQSWIEYQNKKVEEEESLNFE